MRKVVNISMPDHLYQEIEQEIKQGRYGTKSEFFRDMLRAWKHKEFYQPKKNFNASLLLKNARKHAGKGGPKDLSKRHDFYLYGK